jgi:hypothetical protein
VVKPKPTPDMARPEGLEPPTLWFEARYSIQLSYGRGADTVPLEAEFLLAIHGALNPGRNILFRRSPGRSDASQNSRFAQLSYGRGVDIVPLEAEFLLAIHGALNPKPKHRSKLLYFTSRTLLFHCYRCPYAVKKFICAWLAACIIVTDNK